MGFRFRRILEIAPGLRINFNKKSTSITMGTRGAHHTINSSGTEATSIGLPGTGLSYTSYNSQNSKKPGTTPKSVPKTPSEAIESKCIIYKKMANCFLFIAIVFAILSFLWIWCIPLAIGSFIIYFILLYAYYEIYTKEARKYINNKK